MTYPSQDVPRDVPDQGMITSTLRINDIGTIVDIRVTNLTLQHTYASDLSAYLISPQGTRIALFTNVCGSNSWTAANTGFNIGRQATGRMGSVCPPGQGTYLPKDGTIDPFVGQQASGTWTLEVSDGGPYDVGTLLAWSLWIGYTGPVCPLAGVWQETATAAIPPPTATSTPLSGDFADVPSDGTFYPYIQWIASRGFAGGYNCGGPGEPCPGHYFRPSANVTRGQLLKIVVNAMGWTLLNPKEPTFSDVSRTDTFYRYVETAYARTIVGGYPCSAPGEPCDSSNKPYFRPGT
jgi:subtilisin-like proprotein convertase family protein